MCKNKVPTEDIHLDTSYMTLCPSSTAANLEYRVQNKSFSKAACWGGPAAPSEISICDVSVEEKRDFRLETVVAAAAVVVVVVFMVVVEVGRIVRDEDGIGSIVLPNTFCGLTEKSSSRRRSVLCHIFKIFKISHATLNSGARRITYRSSTSSNVPSTKA